MTNIDLVNRISVTEIPFQDEREIESQHQVNGVSLDLLIESGSYVDLMMNASDGSGYWTRDYAVVGGSLVRLYKLIHCVLDQTVKGRFEAIFIFARLVFETNVTIRFVLRNFSPELVDSYIRHSLKHEKRLQQMVQSDVSDSTSEPRAIQSRILNSIDRMARAGEIELDSVELKDRRPWGGKNGYEKARDVGLGERYLAMFGGPSHSIHGGWMDLLTHHLEWEEGLGFKPRMDFLQPHPFVLLALSSMTAETMIDVANSIADEGMLVVLQNRLHDLIRRSSEVSSLFEMYLANKGSGLKQM